MAGRFTILASGSSGNAALLEADGFGLLIDCGLHPRTLTARLREIDAGWDRINAVILTHTHGDHWKEFTLADLRSRKIPIYAHVEQFEQLSMAALSYQSLRQAKLARTYADNCLLELVSGLVVRPIRVSHDAEPTFAFRIECRDSQGVVWSVGYASDLGCGSAELIEAFAGVDVLALEFNHDEKLERKSRRPKVLVDRVLSDYGHLSNAQAAELTTAIAAKSGPGFPSHLVQLHLSRECNDPELASAAGREALAALRPRAEVITARQNVATKPISLGRKNNSAKAEPVRKTFTAYSTSQIRKQPSLPGFDS
jgi:phosphoribosyl 1,2-cyclic phosphodiesterase